jgi:FtsP/CotA-like multicopper oxidase with cupredoxin domain
VKGSGGPLIGFPTRRQLIAGAAAFAAGGALARVIGRSSKAHAEAAALRSVDGRLQVSLVAAERPQALPCFAGRTLPLWTFADDTFLPILRLKAGETLQAKVTNRLPRPGEHISIHWHGIRLPNAEDGVPYLTQQPVPPGDDFTYEFAPPDTGTFFFHTHCNTAEQLGRGLEGILIVEGDETEPYDAERLVVLRDWVIGADARLGPFLTGEAARAGTFGNVRSANGETEPTIPVPASADVRLRVLNIDRTRIMQLGVEGADCAVVAVDGNAVLPFPLKAWFTGPAMRLDIVMRSPAPGGSATLYDYFAPEPVPLAHLAAEGPALRQAAFAPAPLKAAAIAEPALDKAQKLTFTFSATATGQVVSASAAEAGPGVLIDSLCSASQNFWAINKAAWPAGDHSRLPPPIATLKRGESYVFELRNVTPNMHPIHIHGHTFKVLKSNKRQLPLHHADTVLLHPNERVQAAFVADNPGDWMFHCHIIEHQETGMMSYIRVA